MMKPKIANRVQSEISARNEDENVGTESMARGINATNLISERVKLDRYGEKLHAWKEKQPTRSDVLKNGAEKQTAKDIQKSRARRQMIDIYQKKKAKETAGTAAGLGKKFVDASSDMAGRIGEFVVEHIAQDPKPFVIIGIIALLLVLVCCMFSSCTLMAGGINSSAIATYTAEDNVILAVDADYVALESELREDINSIETDYPDYDEYSYELVEIGHNPYQLAALLTVLYEDYTQSEVQRELQSIFDAQYELTRTESTEARTRTETQTRLEQKSREEIRTGTRPVWDEQSWRYVSETYTYTETVYYWEEVEYEVEVEYDCNILKVVLTNNMDSAIHSYDLSVDSLERYKLLLANYGNKQYLFGGDIYSVVNRGDYQGYNIPAEYLTDQKFGRMIQCAEQYLRQAYVWGGSLPSTGFDCSGYVSYVINNCGNGWNIGRKTANGLLACCTSVSAADAKPGDLIFFQGTNNTPGVSHVGIYVGNGMMLHCGNPIQYTSINTTYWQEHFYTYGRIN